MGLFGLFRPKPKPCTACGQESLGLHRVYSGLRDGQEVDRLCTDCLLTRLAPRVQGKSILFAEPITSDGYTFMPLGEVDNPLAQERLRLALASRGAQCAICCQQPSHLWVPLDETEDTTVAGYPAGDYTIPLLPAQWQATIALCDEHIIWKFGAFISEKRFHFGTFRFPDESPEGYYW